MRIKNELIEKLRAKIQNNKEWFSMWIFYYRFYKYKQSRNEMKENINERVWIEWFELKVFRKECKLNPMSKTYEDKLKIGSYKITKQFQQ